MSRPLLYIDVDGPLNPFAAKASRRPPGYETHRLLPQSWIDQHPDTPPHRVRPLRVWLNPAHGAELLTLGFDLVWATTWECDANTMIGPRIGLPELPVVEWAPNQQRCNLDGTFWKTADILRHAAGRPFAWIDDDITRRDRNYVAHHHPAPALLHYVDPARGLTTGDFDTLACWPPDC